MLMNASMHATAWCAQRTKMLKIGIALEWKDTQMHLWPIPYKTFVTVLLAKHDYHEHHCPFLQKLKSSGLAV